jgi:hypothetical protein
LVEAGKTIFETIANKARLVLFYMHRRYLGFIKALEIADAVIAIHPAISTGLDNAVQKAGNAASRSMVLYPEINLGFVNQHDELRYLPFGFTLSGTLTRYRDAVVKKLIGKYRQLDYPGPCYKYVPFEQAPGILLGENRVRFQYGTVEGDYLYNLNPPQRKRWSYSSPMRILRAALQGQIPVVTKKFGDHPIEDIALVWDGTSDTSYEMLRLASSGRDELIEKYSASIEAYNHWAKKQNKEILEAVKTLANAVAERPTPADVRSHPDPAVLSHARNRRAAAKSFDFVRHVAR